MTRPSPDFQVDELPGDQYPGLAEAQHAALPILAADLATTINSLLISGALVKVNGRIQPTKGGKQ